MFADLFGVLKRVQAIKNTLVLPSGGAINESFSGDLEQHPLISRHAHVDGVPAKDMRQKGMQDFVLL